MSVLPSSGNHQHFAHQGAFILQRTSFWCPQKVAQDTLVNDHFSTIRIQHSTRRNRSRRKRTAAGCDVARQAAQHSEQQAGFTPPLPLEDDGHVVNLSSVQDLVDSGALRLARRPLDYDDRRTDGYTEPLELYVLGTSHVAEASSADVFRVVRAVRPQSVVVELCKSRAGLMMPVAEDSDPSGPLQLSGEGFASTLARSIRLGGQTAVLLRAALAWTVQGSMENGGPAMPMYGDFRAAREAADELNAQIVLGDRPLEITLQRAWQALSFEERLDLGKTLLALAFQRWTSGSGSGTKRDNKGRTNGATAESGAKTGEDEGAGAAGVEELRRSVSEGAVEDDMLEALIALLAERLPSVVGPLINERDLYLAWTLKRSRAVCGQRRIVGVVGKGHLAGVMRAVSSDKGGDTLVFKELAGGSASKDGKRSDAVGNNSRVRKAGRVAARLAVETVAGFALWELYKTITA